MKPIDSNPPLTSVLRLITFAEVFVLAAVGIGLFLLPDFTREQWPWALTPFNTRFLGAVYISAMAAVAVMFYVGRWSPARPVLWTIFIFTILVLVVSLLSMAQFDLQVWSTWLWIALYVILPVSAVLHLWFYRKQPPAQAVPVPTTWRRVLLVASAALGLYGVGLLAAPGLVSAFWPWLLDPFHAQLYSAVFVSGAVGLFTVAFRASPLEFSVAGLTQALLGALALIGLLWVDMQVRRVNWSETGTWMWIGMFIALLCLGTAMITAGIKARQAEQEL